MHDPVLRQTNPAPGRGISFARVILKTLLFVLITVVVLNPNLKRAAMQVRHAIQPERVLQAPCASLPLMNAHVDDFMARYEGRLSEARVVAKFVVRNIRYVSDYENWGNLEYWPTPEETWRKQQEDCDGRAILAARILRSRGYESARLIVGLDHMWIMVDENEKDPYKPRQYVALLSPNPNFSLDWSEGPRGNKMFRLVRAFLHPTALRETSVHFFADIPPVRKALLVSALLILCYHPCRNRVGLLGVLATGLAAVAVLAEWRPGNEQAVRGAIGGSILLVAVLCSVLMPSLMRLSESVRHLWLRRSTAVLGMGWPQP